MLNFIIYFKFLDNVLIKENRKIRNKRYYMKKKTKHQVPISNNKVSECVTAIEKDIDYSKVMNNANDPKSRFLQQAFKFEQDMLNCKFKYCKVCHQRRLIMVTKTDVCSRCSSQKTVQLFTHENKALPTWTERNRVYYNLPKELKNLTIAEKMLIQRVSPLIPVIHLKNGILGSRGHIVSFFQDLSTICNIFPRLPSEVSIVRVIRKSTTKAGDDVSKSFTVNRMRVLNALRWLKLHNPLYKDIEIDETRLNWLKGKKSATLNDCLVIESTFDEEKCNDR